MPKQIFIIDSAEAERIEKLVIDEVTRRTKEWEESRPREDIEKHINTTPPPATILAEGKLLGVRKMKQFCTLISIDDTIGERAEKYADAEHYDLESYDEGGYLGIDKKAFADHLTKFASEQATITEHEKLNMFQWVIDNYNGWFGDFTSEQLLEIYSTGKLEQ